MSYGNQRSNTGGYQRILIVFCILVALLCEGVSAGQVNQVKKCAEINEYVSSERYVVVDPVFFFFFVCLFCLCLLALLRSMVIFFFNLVNNAKMTFFVSVFIFYFLLFNFYF